MFGNLTSGKIPLFLSPLLSFHIILPIFQFQGNPRKKNRKYGYNIRWAMPWSKDHIFLANVLYYIADMNITPMLNI
jgi:hypothetical protein